MTKRGAQSPCFALVEIRELVQIIVVKQHADASLPSASVVALPTTTPLAALSDEVLLSSGVPLNGWLTCAASENSLLVIAEHNACRKAPQSGPLR